MRMMPCVGQKEASKRPLYGLPKPNSNLSGEDHEIIRTCVPFPFCIETLRRYVSHFIFCIETLKIHVSYHFIF